MLGSPLGSRFFGNAKREGRALPYERGENTPHPPSYLRHPLPRGEGVDFSGRAGIPRLTPWAKICRPCRGWDAPPPGVHSGIFPRGTADPACAGPTLRRQKPQAVYNGVGFVKRF